MHTERELSAVIPTSHTPRETRNQHWFDDAENLSTAALYKIIVENKFQPPIIGNKITSLGAARSDMHNIYNWPFKIIKDTKLIMFPFKINHDIIYAKDKLKDGAYYCYCAYVLRISRYSSFISVILTNTGIFFRGLKLSGESR